jgi:succinate dehydrogenase/fumarate reductase flavoprotein subunit
MALALDLLVLGGGMAGLAAGARAAEIGARVSVVEKAATPGGSAALSAGIVWTAPDFPTLREVVPGGAPELGRALVDGFWPAVDRLRSTGASVSERWEGQMGFGSAVRVDIKAVLESWQDSITRAGGEILLASTAHSLMTDAAGHVVGAVVGGPAGRRSIAAGAVLLATGGFQGDRELLASFIGPGADSMLLRSNRGSVGDGFRMGRDVGASASAGMSGFYGHLVPSPLQEFREDQFLSLTQYYSNHCILVNRLGKRFTDESLGDEVSNQATLRQPGSRAVLLCDERIHREYAAAAPYPHGAVVDRIAAAESVGARFERAATRDGLVDAIASWGVPRTILDETIERSAAEPLSTPPFFAIEVQPTITFTLGGLAVDADGRVLDRDGKPVPALFAAGADAGGLQDYRYVGGLALGAVFGPRAAEAALRYVNKTGGRLAVDG